MNKITLLRLLAALFSVVLCSALRAEHNALINLGYVGEGQTLQMDASLYSYSAAYTSELINLDTNEVVGSLDAIYDGNSDDPGTYFVSGVSGTSDQYRNAMYWEYGQHVYWTVYNLPAGNYRLRVSDVSAYSGSSLYNGEILDGTDGEANFSFYTPYGGDYDGSFGYWFGIY